MFVSLSFEVYVQKFIIIEQIQASCFLLSAYESPFYYYFFMLQKTLASLNAKFRFSFSTTKETEGLPNVKNFALSIIMKNVEIKIALRNR